MSKHDLKVDIREAEPSDYPAMQALINEAYSVEDFFKTCKRIDQAEIISNAQKGKFLLASERGMPVPAACIYTKVRGEKGYFGLLSVHPALQGKGLAVKLISAAEELSRKQGCTTMEIEVVNLRTELFPFYNKLGYKQTGTTPFVDMERSRLPCHFVLMSKVLI